MSQRQLRKFVETATIIAALSLSLTSYSVAATDIFIKIDGIQGESQDDKHRGEVDVLSWSWGANQTGTSHVASGGGGGKPSFQDISITKYTDKASPLLLGNLASGRHIKEMHLTVRKAGGKPLEFLKLHLYDCLVSSVSLGSAGTSERMTENVSINFGRYKMEYVPQRQDGSGDTPVSSGWDISRNTAN